MHKKFTKILWTPEQLEKLRADIAAGQSVNDLAVDYKRSPKTIYIKLTELKLEYVWYINKIKAGEVRDQQIIEMIKEGKTYAQIAQVLGLARGSISSAVDRMKRKQCFPFVPQTPAAPVDDEPFLPKPPPDRKVVLRKPYPQLPQLQVKYREGEPISKQLSCEDLLYTSCRYVHGDPKHHHHYCGHTQKVGSPYCDFHSRLCYMTPAEWERERARINAAMAASKRMR